MVLVFNLAATAVTVMLGKILSWPVFGPALASAYVLLVILLGVQLVNPAAGFVGFLRNMTGREQETARGIAIAAGINIVPNLLLIPRLRIKGGATATAVSTVVWNALPWWAVRKRLGINSLAFDFRVRRLS